jgi:hypothetical protein
MDLVKSTSAKAIENAKVCCPQRVDVVDNNQVLSKSGRFSPTRFLLHYDLHNGFGK